MKECVDWNGSGHNGPRDSETRVGDHFLHPAVVVFRSTGIGSHKHRVVKAFANVRASNRQFVMVDGHDSSPLLVKMTMIIMVNKNNGSEHNITKLINDRRWIRFNSCSIIVRRRSSKTASPVLPSRRSIQFGKLLLLFEPSILSWGIPLSGSKNIIVMLSSSSLSLGIPVSPLRSVCSVWHVVVVVAQLPTIEWSSMSDAVVIVTWTPWWCCRFVNYETRSAYTVHRFECAVSRSVLRCALASCTLQSCTTYRQPAPVTFWWRMAYRPKTLQVVGCSKCKRTAQW